MTDLSYRRCGEQARSRRRAAVGAVRGEEAGSFRIEPDYAREKVVGLTHDVAETYAPVKITVAYAGRTPVPKPFLMILEWIAQPGRSGKVRVRGQTR